MKIAGDSPPKIVFQQWTDPHRTEWEGIWTRLTEISAHNLNSQHQQKVSHNDNNTTMSRQQSTNTK